LSVSNAKVIILEDDQALAKAWGQLLEKEGISALITSRPDEARDFLGRHRVSTLFVDCLLPTENGVDFAQSIRQQFPKEILDIVLMSGIFTDQSFVKESLRAAGAIAFLKKPFANEELLGYIRRADTRDEGHHPRKVLYQLFSRQGATTREKRKAIEALEDIHGFDLPFIFHILVEARLSGHLNIVADRGDVSGISFSDGDIVGVDIADKATYLGKLLIESGFLLREDLDEALNVKSTKKLGERLIQGNLVSPHGFDVVLSNQMSIRLSRTIVDQNVKVNFVMTEVEKTSPSISAELFENFLHDWIASKISVEWFRAHFMQWANARVVKTGLFEKRASVLNRPLVANLEGLIAKVTSGQTLTELFDSRIYPEDTLYKSLHFLLTLGLISFEEGKVLSSSERLRLMRKMMQQFANRNRLEIFDLMAKMTSLPDSQSDQVYKEYMGLLGEPPSITEKELYGLYTQLVQIGKGAYDFARSGNRDKMKEELMKGEVEIKLKASTLFDEARNNLQKSQYKEALVMIQKAANLDPKIDKLHLYLAWAKLGTLDPKNKLAALKEVDMDMMQIAPEDKFDSIYNFVVGLYAKAKGDSGAARKSFEKAIAMDNSMIVARRELTVLSSISTTKTDLLNSDLKSLVGSLFKKSR
jgi:FixJ family two-component response regulator/tetratricopeptide (TPR) repeat protein